MELSSSNIKNNSYIFSKEGFSYISGNGSRHFSVQARKNKKNPPRKKFVTSPEMELSSSDIKKFLIFYYISGNRDF